MRMTVTLTIDVDTAAWATEYGLPIEQVPADALSHVTAHVRQAADSRGEQLGTFAVHDSSGAIDADWASPPCAPPRARTSGHAARDIVHAAVLLGGCGQADVGELILTDEVNLADTTCPTCRTALVAAGTVAP